MDRVQLPQEPSLAFCEGYIIPHAFRSGVRQDFFRDGDRVVESVEPNGRDVVV